MNPEFQTNPKRDAANAEEIWINHIVQEKNDELWKYAGNVWYYEDLKCVLNLLGQTEKCVGINIV